MYFQMFELLAALDLFQTLKLALEIETYQAPLALFKYSTLNDQS